MKNITIGTYNLGLDFVEIIFREGTGAEFCTKPGHGNIQTITLGIDYKQWSKIVSNLIHEATELSYLRQHCRYWPDDRISQDHSSYIFIADHKTFSECCEIVGNLIVDALPDISIAWKKYK